jgi:hypothetical protein
MKVKNTGNCLKLVLTRVLTGKIYTSMWCLNNLNC